jgi:hypothetical protein
MGLTKNGANTKDVTKGFRLPKIQSEILKGLKRQAIFQTCLFNLLAPVVQFFRRDALTPEKPDPLDSENPLFQIVTFMSASP